MATQRPNDTRRTRTRLGGIGGAVAVMAMLASALGVTGASGAAGPASYDENLAMIRSASVRNTNHDASADRSTAQADLVIDDHLGPRSAYLGNPGGNPEQSFPVTGSGQFRAACEFSHFAYDDPLTKWGRPGAAHLHMFWGNTDTNAFTTLDSLTNSGSSTCNGGELNRTGYWAPAMFDGRGNVRVPERIIVYYKGYGLANGRSQVYPPGAAMVAQENVHAIPWDQGGTFGPGTGDWSFNCGDQFRGLRNPAANTIPSCDGSKFLNEYGVVDDPHATLEMHVKFPNCWNGQDASNPSNWGLARIGGWFYSECEERATFPNIEYIIAYPLEIGETTDDWFLSSDVDPATYEMVGEGGSTTHADWWGGWQPDINRQWIDNCVNPQTEQPSDCGFGYLTDGGPDGDAPLPGPALAIRPQYTGPMKVDADTLFQELCPVTRTPGRVTEAAYCMPGGGAPPTTSPATTSAPATVPATTVPPTTVPPTTVSPTTVPLTTVPPTTVPPTTVPPTTVPPTTVPPTTTTVTTVTLPLCDGRAATIVGTDGDDVITGTAGSDVIVAGGGDDIVNAGALDDLVCGEDGDDMVIGGPGNDDLRGNAGNDVSVGGRGLDRMDGGTGDDVLIDPWSRSIVDGGEGTDRCVVSRTSAAESCETLNRVTAARARPR